MDLDWLLEIRAVCQTLSDDVNFKEFIGKPFIIMIIITLCNWVNNMKIPFICHTLSFKSLYANFGAPERNRYVLIIKGRWKRPSVWLEISRRQLILMSEYIFFVTQPELQPCTFTRCKNVSGVSAMIRIVHNVNG